MKVSVKASVKDVSTCYILVEMVTKLGFVMTEVPIWRLCCKLHRFAHLGLDQHGVRDVVL